jgi:hypothetical protein
MSRATLEDQYEKTLQENVSLRGQLAEAEKDKDCGSGVSGCANMKMTCVRCTIQDFQDKLAEAERNLETSIAVGRNLTRQREALREAAVALLAVYDEADLKQAEPLRHTEVVNRVRAIAAAQDAPQSPTEEEPPCND